MARIQVVAGMTDSPNGTKEHCNESFIDPAAGFTHDNHERAQRGG